MLRAAQVAGRWSAASAALGAQRRWTSTKMVATAERFSARGFVNTMPRESSHKNVTSLGCVVYRFTLDWNKHGPYSGFFHRLNIVWRLVRNWWNLQKMSRSRDDVTLPAFENLYVEYKKAEYAGNSRQLKRLLSPYEFHTHEERVKEQRKAAGYRKTPVRSCVVDVKRKRFVHSIFIDMQGEEFAQISVFFESEVTNTEAGQEFTPKPVREYCCFEVRISARQGESVTHPIRIAGLYDEDGDRIGTDVVSPDLLRDMLAKSGISG
eukprot:TRINITY_DN28513_c0_g1_i1.p2 TRINITY_DN28513_c0_g1~~TRINITY_DN28513_c0_g1_i1.p2  ORF type:complete len:265 (+),score=70.81 TRINITY_DN28513_c0_g1_i1:63-857(+)